MWELFFHLTTYEYFRDNVCVDLYCSCTYGFSCFGGVLDMVNSRVLGLVCAC